jgi:hypothetical protein
MSYVSYMSRNEALRHIQQVKGCTRPRAIELLVAAMQAVAIWPSTLLFSDFLRGTTGRPRPIYNGIDEAIGAIWPDGIPAGLKSKDRDRKIRAWLESNRCTPPASSQSLTRGIQRVLRDRRRI